MWYQEPAWVCDPFERIVVDDRFGSMLHSICILGFLVLFSDVSVNKWFFSNIGGGLKVDSTVQVV